MREALIQILAAYFGAFGFALLFGIRKKYILLIALDGALSWTVYRLCALIAPPFYCNLAAALFCGFFAAILARIIEVPTTVLLMPATVPMIPGSSLYYTIYYLYQGDVQLAKQAGISTIRTVFALAIGFALVNIVVKRHRDFLGKAFSPHRKGNDH